ncbi:MAG TPA: tyrosinase family protein [Thermoanaerobaculia bacterium]|nr:tyrosinase family protein [Thermoanaerobaculia bacterium]
MSWETFIQSPARVQSLRNAVAVMRSRNSADRTSALYRTSWEYWASMHGYFGPTSPFGTVEFGRQRYVNSGGDPFLFPLFNGITNMTPPDSVAQQVWAQCQHGTPWFFAWHRIYLYYFEQVLQAAANDPDLRLPYWDYTDPAQVAMPAPYSDSTYDDALGHLVLNPLFEPRRVPGWNPPGGVTLDPKLTNIDDALKLKPYFGDPGVGFQSTIERGVHGTVHCSVVDCPATDMGAVGYSANDPIFWAHHANIDRMWDCWTSLGNKNPTDDSNWMNKSFSFVNAKGELVTNKVSDLFDGTIKLGYVYQQASNCSRAAAPTPPLAAPSAAPMSDAAMQSARAKLAKPAVLGEVKGHVINAAVSRMRLPIAGGSSMAPLRALAMRGNAALPVKTELVLRNIQFTNHPGKQFNVILERRDDPTKRVYVGTLSFFESGMPGHEHDEATINRTFDVTDELRQLAAASDLKEVNVVFEVTTGRIAPGEDEMSFDPQDTKLTVGEIDLVVEAADQ